MKLNLQLAARGWLVAVIHVLLVIHISEYQYIRFISLPAAYQLITNQ